MEELPLDSTASTSTCTVVVEKQNEPKPQTILELEEEEDQDEIQIIEVVSTNKSNLKKNLYTYLIQTEIAILINV